MSNKYTKREKAQILAQARRHTAVRRADALREKRLLMREEEKRRARQPQQTPRTYGAPELDRVDVLIDLIATGLGVFLRRQS